MKKTSWPWVAGGVVFLSAAAGIGFGLGRIAPSPSSPTVQGQPGPVVYYRDPDGKPAYSVGPAKTQDGRDYLRVFAGDDVTFSESGGVATTTSGGQGQRILYYRNPMGGTDTSPTPKKDSMGMAYVPVYEADNGASRSGNFQFELVKTEFGIGTATIAVRLIDKRSGKPVPDAVIFAQRVDMSPSQMPAMTTSLKQMPSTQAGIYLFSGVLRMQGKWRLALAAKIQGEAQTLLGDLVIEAKS